MLASSPERLAHSREASCRNSRLPGEFIREALSQAEQALPDGNIDVRVIGLTG
ncbi:hypothetical protein [Pseudomonas sp. 2822-15]|uniref:hypothetical protein n=1 Tax=Pseudomonas sp. 2822-15 TaxID=1712677 RepID=UPI00130401A1|nr:hypothetical protein [Pseudomonas sp. 2822-15]